MCCDWFGVQMKWHEGNSLLQTVYTCLYMHHLSSMNPELLDEGLMDHAYTPDRPLKLVTHALRAGILGMVKCVDYAYRELVKGNVHDVRLPSSEIHRRKLTHLIQSVRIGKVTRRMCHYVKAYNRRKSYKY